MQNNLCVHLAEASHVRVIGQGSTGFDAVTNADQNFRTNRNGLAHAAALTNDPNVGGFGQVDAEIVLQNPVRIYGLLAFFAAVALAQIMLVLKKKQIEKVQAAEGNF